MIASRPGKRALAIASLAAAAVAALLAGSPAPAGAAAAPPGSTPDVAYAPSVPTSKSVMDANGVPNNSLGGFSTGTTNRHITSQLYAYADALVSATASNPRVKVVSFDAGPTTLGQF